MKTARLQGFQGLSMPVLPPETVPTLENTGVPGISPRNASRDQPGARVPAPASFASMLSRARERNGPSTSACLFPNIPVNPKTNPNILPGICPGIYASILPVKLSRKYCPEFMLEFMLEIMPEKVPVKFGHFRSNIYLDIFNPFRGYIS